MPLNTRTQIDDKGDTISRMTGLDCTGSTDMARQEYGPDADINTLMNKFGINAPNRPVTYGEVDTNLDLQTALAAIDQSRAAYKRLAPEIKKEFNTWQKFVNAMNDGTLLTKLDQLGKAHADEEQLKKMAKTEEKPKTDT